MATDEVRDGVELTNLDQRLVDGADETKRDLVDYLDAVADKIIPALADRPLSVIRVLHGQGAFMQKNLPKYTPPWVPRVQLWAESAKRDVTYALCNDRRTLLWFANQRAVEFHPALATIDQPDSPTHLVLDIDPPEASFRLAVEAARLVRQALSDVGMLGAVKTSGAKGLHVFVPLVGATSEEVGCNPRISGTRRAVGPRARHDSFRPRGPWRQGVPRFNAGWRRNCRRRLQSSAAHWTAGVVSGELGRTRQRLARGLHRSHRSCTAVGMRPVGRAATRSAAVELGPGGRRTTHSHRARPGHA
jgi:DNA ligase D-like protein (predicted polymerase)